MSDGVSLPSPPMPQKSSAACHVNWAGSNVKPNSVSKKIQSQTASMYIKAKAEFVIIIPLNPITVLTIILLGEESIEEASVRN